MAAKLLLRNLLTAIKTFILPEQVNTDRSFDNAELALDQCNSYYIAEARRPGQLPRAAKRFNIFSVKAIVLAATLVVAGLGFVGNVFAQTPVISYTGSPFTYSQNSP